MTQAELAKESGVSRSWLAQVEGGKVSVEFGLLFNVVECLGLVFEMHANKQTNNVDLNAIIEAGIENV